METISLQAQMYLQLGRPAIRGNFLVDITVRAASRNGAGLAHREPRRFLTNPDFWNEFTAEAVDLVFGAALHGLFTPAALPADEMRDDTLGILDEFDRRHAHAREKRSL